MVGDAFFREHGRQVAALCWRAAPAPEILLITSLSSKRWIIPTGWPDPEQTLAESAAREAFEEAGVTGKIEAQPLCRYHYLKEKKDGGMPCSVEVFALQVTRQVDDFPEKGPAHPGLDESGPGRGACRRTGAAPDSCAIPANTCRTPKHAVTPADARVLILKLTIVPFTLLIIGHCRAAARPACGGWLTGFRWWRFRSWCSSPWIMARPSAAPRRWGSWFGAVPWLAFTAAYAYAARNHGWLWATIASFAVWGAISVMMVAMSNASRWFELLPCWPSRRRCGFIPRGPASDGEREHCLVGGFRRG